MKSALVVTVLFGVINLNGMGHAQESDKQPSMAEHLMSLKEVTDRQAVCGLNSVYGFLKLNDVDAEYDEVESVLGTSRDGCSLLSLKDLCSHYGLKTEVVRCQEIDFRAMDLPIVLYNGKGTVSEGTGEFRMGHFVLLLQYKGDTVYYMDGTTGEVDHAPEEWFKEHVASETILRLKDTRNLRFATASTVSSSLLLLMSVCWVFRKRT